MPDFHEPVMLTEVLEILKPQSGEVFVDATVGGGGHSIEIVKRLLPNGKLIGIDRDTEAIQAASERLKQYSNNVMLLKDNFADIARVIKNAGFDEADGILMDLGVSSYQLEKGERGFSFRCEAPLDMRMDTSQEMTASEIVNSLSERKLAEVIREYGEDRWARRIAKFIVERREKKPIRTTTDLVDIILAAVPSAARPKDIHPATRTFQALRIAVNKELESLRTGLDEAVSLLKKGGRLCVISYHSLEDRIVKQAFARHAGRCICPTGFPVCVCGAKKIINVITKHPMTPSESEVRANPRARSARMRAAEKL